VTKGKVGVILRDPVRRDKFCTKDFFSAVTSCSLRIKQTSGSANLRAIWFMGCLAGVVRVAVAETPLDKLSGFLRTGRPSSYHRAHWNAMFLRWVTFVALASEALRRVSELTFHSANQDVRKADLLRWSVDILLGDQMGKVMEFAWLIGHPVPLSVWIEMAVEGII